MQGMPIHIELSEDVTFLNKAGIRRTLNELPRGSRVIIDARRTIDLDPDVKEIIDVAVANAKSKDITYELIGFRKKPKRSLMELQHEMGKVSRQMAEQPTEH